MQSSDRVVDCSSPRKDNNVPAPPVALVDDVLDRDRDETRSTKTARSNRHYQGVSTMQTIYSAGGCLSPSEDGDAPYPYGMMGYGELHEILSWMPAKSAIKYSSSLCKWLCNIHSQPLFIQKQCIRSCGLNNGLFLQNKRKDYVDDPVQTHIEFKLLPSETGSAFGIPSESLDYLTNYGHILSSSNGLLLLGKRVRCLLGSYEFRVCNPVTREWATLPTPRGFRYIVNHNSCPLIECYPGRHEDVEFPNDYTIALPVATLNGFSDQKKKLLIYSNGRWDEELCDLTVEGRVVRYDMPVGIFSDATKGLIVHYLCDRGNSTYLQLKPYIAAFDIREKKLLREIKLPDGPWDVGNHNLWGGTKHELRIFKWNETSICLVRWWMFGGLFDAWVLECQGESLWRRVVSMSERDLWCGWYRLGAVTLSVGIVSGKGLLIATGPANPVSDEDDDEPSVPVEAASRLFLYVMEGEGKGRLEVVGEDHTGWEGVRFMSYANTLRPVSVQNAQTYTY